MAQLAGLFPPPTPEEAPIAQTMMQGAATSEGAGGFGVGGDRSSLTLHADEEALIQAVAAATADRAGWDAETDDVADDASESR